MPYSSINDIPKALKTAGLSLGQANDWARYLDEAKKQKSIGSPAAIAWTRFKQKYYKTENTWKIKRSYKGEKMDSPKKLKGYTLFYRKSPKPTVLEDTDAEGKIYVKELIREGEWAHPQRPHVRLKITLKRMQKWLENFKKDLFKVPVPKRHSLDPEDNRGWVEKLFIDKNNDGINTLYGHLDITNNKMQKSINDGDIQDVSVSIGDYVDNQGVKHGEALQHVALTVIPHIDSQGGFKPINAEGYICLEEESYMEELSEKIKNGETFDDIETEPIIDKPEGSDERKKQEISAAIETARIFAEPSNFHIVATYEHRVIVQYYGGGEGATGEVVNDRYFEIPYAMGLNGDYIFGDKIELVKKYYFIEKDVAVLEKLSDEDESELKQIKELLVMGKIEFDQIVNRDDISTTVKKRIIETLGKKIKVEKNTKEVKSMMEFEKLQAEKAKLEQEKVDLEAKVTDLETKVTDLGTKVSGLEKEGKEKDDKIKASDDEKKVAFEKVVDAKVDKLIKEQKIVPASKDKVKEVLMAGGIAAELLEKSLSNQEKAFDTEVKTETKSEKPKNEDKKKVDAEKEATRIIEGK